MSYNRFLIAAVLLTASLTAGVPTASIALGHALPAQSRRLTLTRLQDHYAHAEKDPQESTRLVSARSAIKAQAKRFSVCSLFGSGDITPCNEVGTASVGTQTKNFTVTNNHASNVNFSVSASCSGTLTACSISPTNFTIPAHSTHSFVAHFTMSAGTGHLVVAYESALDDQGQSDNTYTAGSVIATISPHSASNTVVGGTSIAQTFTLTNTGTIAGGFTFAVSCAGVAVSCTTPVPILSLGSGVPTNLVVNYTSGMRGSGSLKLVAIPSAGTAKDSGTISIAVDSTSTASLDSVGLPGVIARDHCLTISAGADAAYECGDLRIVHPLPATRTKGLPHVPVLLYNSSTAHPFALVAANYTMPSTPPLPDSVVATVLMGGVSQGRAKWLGTDWTLGATRRIEVGFDAITKRTGYYTDTLQIVRYTGTSPSPATIVPGELMIVNRSGRTADSAYFGRGWWIAGLEQLYNLADGTKLWVGGDGSVRHFMKVVGVSNVWTATLVDGVDGLNFDGTNYTRVLPHGLKVRFDGSGKHTATINRLGDSTLFRYDGSGRLSAIKLYPDTTRQYVFQYDANGKLAVVLAPTVGGTARNDSVTIASGLLNRIKGPDTTFVSFGYLAGDTNMLSTRTDRVGTVATYAYGVAKRLRSFTVDPGFSQAVVTLNFSPFETASLTLAGSTRTHAVIADSAFTLLDGARRDTTLFWPNRIGDPNRVRNAMGFMTIVRRDTNFPGLAAWSHDPIGRVHTATYDTHGNPLTVVDSSTYDAVRSKYAVTTYTWDQLWDLPKRVRLPEGDGELRSYSSVTGNVLWEQPDSDSTVTTRRTTFTYFTAGAAKNLLASVNPPLSVNTDSLAYDALGNVNASWSELRFKSRSVVDDIGRVTSTVAPINATDSLASTTAFNLIDEDTATQTFGTTTGSAWADTLVVTKSFDGEGRLLDATRRALPDRASIGTLVTSYRYDNIGRKIKEIAPFAGTDTLFDAWVYDAAGHDTAHTTRRGFTLRTSYDDLGRVYQRIVPAVISDSIAVQYFPDSTGVIVDGWWQFPRYHVFGSKHLLIPQNVSTFAYDAVGAILGAANYDALITRTYYANGQLATDESAVRTWLDVGIGGEFSSHVYRDSIAYDLDGRRKLLRVSSNIAPTAYGSTTPLTDITYGYDAITGQLATVHDMMGSDFKLFYTAAGQVDSVGYPGGIGEKFHYDGQHRLSSRLEKGPTAFWPSGLLHQDSTFYDQRDQLTRAFTFADSTTNQYSLLGQLTQTRFGTSLDDSLYYGDWTNDAMGNRLTYSYRSTPADEEHPPQTFLRSYRYQASTGRLWKDSTANSPYDYYEQYGFGTTSMDSNAYQRSGNQWVHETIPRHDYLNNIGWGRNISISYYSADDKLRAFDQRRCVAKVGVDPPCKPSAELTPSTAGAFEDYRYDAFGRRILVRSRLDTVSSPAPNKTGCTNPSGLCHSAIERYVWDGDQILMEIRMPGGDSISQSDLERDTTTIVDKYAAYGRVTYVHSGVLDHPFAIIRNGYTYDTSSTLKSWAGATEVIPHDSWRGKDDLGSFTDGRKVSPTGFDGDTAGGHCRKVGASTPCMTIAWPEQYAGMFGNPETGFVLQHWFGSLAQEKLDGSGQIFMRNRYYDPNTGRFTQEDPIGLAGGLNAYGFANSNPVSYDDPFGLKLCPPDCSWTDIKGYAKDFWQATKKEVATKGLLGFIREGMRGGNPVLIGAGTLMGEGASAGAAAGANEEGAAGILMPSGSPIGSAGTSENIREVAGGVEDAQAMFARLSEGGTQVKSSYPGTLVSVKGGTVGLRTTMSRSPGTAATIDVNIPSIPVTKVKFNP